MTQTFTIQDVLDAVEKLSEDEREEFYEQMKIKRIEIGRACIQADMDEARCELAAGNHRVMTAEEIVREALDASEFSTTVALLEACPSFPIAATIHS